MSLYLDLLKKCLTRSFDLTGEALARRLEGIDWPPDAETMVGMKRLDNFQWCIEEVLRDGVPGDIVGCGVWRGGASILARAVLREERCSTRRVFVADSFQGLPPPDSRYPADDGDGHHTHTFLSVPIEEVRRNFARYDLLDDQVVFLPGWFKDTLPGPIERLAVLRLDGDMYGSTIETLLALYQLLSPGGFCIIDDYGLDGCRKAVDDFRRDRSIEEPPHHIDWTGRFWRKGVVG